MDPVIGSITGENTETIALLTQTSMGPSARSVAAAAASTWSWWPPSVGTAIRLTACRLDCTPASFEPVNPARQQPDGVAARGECPRGRVADPG